jgi:hypothetical protein
MKIQHLAMAAALLLPITAFAAEGGIQGTMSGHTMSGMERSMPMDGMSPKMFLQKKEIDGYTVSFHVMPASEGMQHGGAHNFMVKVEQGNTTMTDIAVNSKVIAPNGKAVSKMMMQMGDWFMAGYDLKQQGRYQLMVLFKTADGQKHFGGAYYPAKH